MGLSRRVLYKVKFTRKFGEDVYGFLNKSKITKERFLTRLISSMLKSETYNMQQKVVLMVQKTTLVRGLESFLKLFLTFKLELFFLLISKKVQFELKKKHLHFLKSLNKFNIGLYFYSSCFKFKDALNFKNLKPFFFLPLKFNKKMCVNLNFSIRCLLNVREFLARRVILTKVFSLSNIQKIFHQKNRWFRIRTKTLNLTKTKRLYRNVKTKSSKNKPRTSSVLKIIDFINLEIYRKFPNLLIRFPLFSSKKVSSIRLFSLPRKFSKMKKRWQASFLSFLVNAQRKTVSKACRLFLIKLIAKTKQDFLGKNFRLFTKQKFPFFFKASLRQVFLEKTRMFGIENRFSSSPVVTGKLFRLLNTKSNHFIFFERTCMSFSKKYASYFLLNQSDMQKRQWMSEAREISNFFNILLKFLLNYPFVREKFLQEHFQLWIKMLDCVSTSFRSLLQHLSVIGNPIKKESNLTKEVGISFVQFFDKNREIYLQKKAPRLFNFFLSRLEKQYGFFQKDVPFRLDIPLPKTRYKQETEKLLLYRLLKIMRRFWGNLTQKRIWKIRKISGLKLFGHAFFNALLLFESRLDVFLVRAHFCCEMQEARGLIQNGVVLVNGRKILNYNYRVSLQDIVSIFPNFQVQFKNYLLNKMFFTLEEINTIYNKIFPSYLEINFLKLTIGYIPRLFTLEKIPSFLDISKFLLLNWGKFSY